MCIQEEKGDRESDRLQDIHHAQCGIFFWTWPLEGKTHHIRITSFLGCFWGGGVSMLKGDLLDDKETEFRAGWGWNQGWCFGKNVKRDQTRKDANQRRFKR